MGVGSHNGQFFNFSKMNIQTKYNNGNIVKIIPLDNIEGRIIGIFFGLSNIVEYNVKYYDRAESKTVYFFEDELKITYD